MNGKQVAERLKSAGWVLDRINGSHHVFVKNGKTCPVAIHGKRDIPAGTLSKIERITGVSMK